MELKNSFSILASRYSVVFKMLVYFVVITIIHAAILVSIITPSMDNLLIAIQDADLLNQVKQVLSGMITLSITSSDAMVRLNELYLQFIGIINANSEQMIAFYVAITFILFSYRMFISMSSVPIAVSINKYMNTSVHSRLFNVMIENVWVSIKYSFIATFINQLINSALSLLAYWIIKSTVWTWGLFSFTVVLLMLITLLSIKFAVLLGWMPSIVYKKMKVIPALLHSIKICKNWFKYGFLCAFMLYLFAFAGAILIGIATFGIFVPILVVTMMVLLRIVELVNYYNFYKYVYYVDHSTIITQREELY